MSIAYDEYGSGIPFVWIHGHPFNRSMWHDQLELLSPRFHVLLPDLRGYGESEVVPGKTTLEDFALDLAGFLDALHIERIILGGLSMGGQIVQEFYRQFPERVQALILAATSAQLDTPKARAQRYLNADRIVKEGMQDFSQEILPHMLAPQTIEEQPEVADRVHQMMLLLANICQRIASVFQRTRPIPA